MTRSLLLAIVLGLSLTLAGHPSAHSADKAEHKQPNYVHAVIFTLKKDAPKDEAKALVDDAFTLLGKVPSVKRMRVGLPATHATDIAVKDYSVGLVVLFDDYDGLKTYIDHPLHQEYVKKHLKHVEKPLVYDFVQQGN